ncbi:MAG: hypothetical protein M1837_006585 [Sclerophora amabilis]|nr:MAG: hypothetical protein M1837_006585 [Sclerophora amabilis]
MPSYAVLGATINTGQSLMNVLLQSPDNEIHAYVHSESKLQRMSPDLCGLENVKIYQGSIQNSDVISECIAGTQAVFLAVAMSDNMPGCRVAQDTAQTVLRQPRRPPVLRPAALGPRDALACASNVYKDLLDAEKYLRAREDWISFTFIKPGGLVHDAQKGHELSTEIQQSFLSFLDLAAGMVEVADTEGDRWDMKNVSVPPTAPDVKFEWWAPVNLVKGLLCHFFPSAYPYLKS